MSTVTLPARHRLGESAPLPIPPVAVCVAGCSRRVAKAGQACAVCGPDYARGYHHRQAATDADQQAWAALVPTYAPTTLPAWRLRCPLPCGGLLTVLADATDLAPDAGVLGTCGVCNRAWWVTINRREPVEGET